VRRGGARVRHRQELRVVGVLPRTGSPDDGVLFVDLPTMWTIRGLGHRHDDPAEANARAPGALMAQDGANAIAGEALKIERGASDAPAPDFHFHGSSDEFPIDAALVFPRDAKAQAMLLGRFTGSDERLQLVRPDQFIERVLDRIFGVGRVLGSVAAAAALFVALVAATAFALSIRLRADELALMKRLGASRARVASFLAVEAMFLLVAAVAIAGAVALFAPRLRAARAGEGERPRAVRVGLALVAAYVQTVSGFALGLIVMGAVGAFDLAPIAFTALVVSAISLVNVVSALWGRWHQVDRQILQIAAAAMVPAVLGGLAPELRSAEVQADRQSGRAK
jgi:hypothetical protein